MPRDLETIRFSRSNTDGVVAAMRSLEESSGGWINIAPILSEQAMAAVPYRSGLGAWLSGRGPAVPMATWIASTDTGRRPTPAQVGVEHGTGPNGLVRLTDAGHPLPEGWVKRQDHAKHGIVAELPPDADFEVVIAWLVTAVSFLSELIVTGDRWQAAVHRSV